MRIREYGTSGPRVVVLHGGPGAHGYMAPVARGIADLFRVLEPWQRGSGDETLTVARHVADLYELVLSRCEGARPALVGHSWGAMLALAYAAEHPGHTGPVVLIGCGTFDATSRERLRAVHEKRLDDDMRRRLDRLPAEIPDPDERLRVMGVLLQSLYSHDLVSTGEEIERCDARSNRETWEDMLRLQGEGVYPAAFAAIKVPVLMLHGAADPHPGRMIRAGLQPHLPQIEYREWECCGHYPWLEREVREQFFTVLHEWLVKEINGLASSDRSR